MFFRPSSPNLRSAMLPTMSPVRAPRHPDPSIQKMKVATNGPNRTHPLPTVVQRICFKCEDTGCICSGAKPYRTYLMFLLLSSLLFIGFLTFHLRRPVIPASPSSERYFLASTFYKDPELTLNSIHELDRVISYLGASKVFVSAIADASHSRIKSLIDDWKQSLRKRDISFCIVSDEPLNAGDTHAHLQHRLLAAMDLSHCPSESLFDRYADDKLRADAIRRSAKPHKPWVESRTADGHLVRANLPTSHRMHFSRIIFVEESHFTADDVATLLHTNDMDYDVACAMYFSSDGLTDIHGAHRDVTGLSPSSNRYPYLAAPVSQRALRDGMAVAMETCFSPLTIMSAKPFLEGHIQFPDIDHHETLDSSALNPLTVDSTFAMGASEKECTESHGQSDILKVVQQIRAKGFTKTYINPAVKIADDSFQYTLHNQVYPYFNWIFLAGHTHEQLDSSSSSSSSSSAAASAASAASAATSSYSTCHHFL